MDDCSDRYSGCSHNRKQTHYHCIKVHLQVQPLPNLCKGRVPLKFTHIEFYISWNFPKFSSIQLQYVGMYLFLKALGLCSYAVYIVLPS